MKRKTVVFGAAFLVWGILNWVPDWQHILVGLFAAAFVAYLTGDLAITRVGVLKHPHRYRHFFFEYVPLFIWEVIKANIDVAYRVIHPSLPVKPGIVKVRTSLKSDIALTFLANSITLTPGTMCIDIDRENDILYIHWIDVSSEDIEEDTKLLVERFEKILSKIFD